MKFNEETLEETLEKMEGSFQIDKILKINDEGIVTKAIIFFVASENYKYQDKELEERENQMKKEFSDYNFSYPKTIESLENGDAMYEVIITLKD